MAKTMGYEGLLYYGTKGSTAGTQITARRDVTHDTSVEIGETSEAGDGSAVPIVTGEAAARTPSINFSLIISDDSAAVVALQAAAATGDPIALRYIRSTGKLGFDCDCVISTSQGSPYKGEATMDVTVEAVSASLRTPILNG